MIYIHKTENIKKKQRRRAGDLKAGALGDIRIIILRQRRDYAVFMKRFVIVTDPNKGFGSQAILTPKRCMEVVGEHFLPTREELYLH